MLQFPRSFTSGTWSHLAARDSFLMFLVVFLTFYTSSSGIGVTEGWALGAFANIIFFMHAFFSWKKTRPFLSPGQWIWSPNSWGDITGSLFDAFESWLRLRWLLLRRCKLGPFRLGRALELLSDKSSQAIGCWSVWTENGTWWTMKPDVFSCFFYVKSYEVNSGWVFFDGQAASCDFVGILGERFDVFRLPSSNYQINTEESWRIIGVHVVALWGGPISVWNL